MIKEIKMDTESDLLHTSSISLQDQNDSTTMQLPFPAKLYNLLENADASIIDWLPDGRAFRIFDMNRFVKLVLPRNFKRKFILLLHL